MGIQTFIHFVARIPQLPIMMLLASFVATPAFAQNLGGNVQKNAEIAPQVLRNASTDLALNNTLGMLITIVGTALYFGALVRTKNTLSTMAQVMLSACTATVIWVLFAGELALFNPGASWLAAINSLGSENPAGARRLVDFLPLLVLVSAVLFGGAAERIRLLALFILTACWTVLIAAPIIRTVQSGSGFLALLGFQDWVGAGSLHLAVGVCALVICIVTGNRHGYGRVAMPPYHLGLAFIGALVMILGWTLSLISAGEISSSASLSHVAAKLFIGGIGGALAWSAIEQLNRRLLSTLGMVSGAIAGAVACSAGAVWMSPRIAILIGVLGAAAAYLGAVILRRIHQRDDAMDIFALHALPALVGLLALPFLDSAQARFGTQLAGAVVLIVYSGILIAVVAIPLKALGVLRVNFDHEDAGLDLTVHGETVHPPQPSL
jgi:ammonium transporter, Amt family